MSPAPSIDELVVADEPAPWRDLGFTIDGDTALIGSVRLRLAGRGAGDGLVSWSIRDAASTELDGLPTAAAAAPPPERGEHPNGARSLDHVVVLTPSLDRTAAAFEAAGVALRRVREVGQARQGFLRMGEVIVELVENADGAAADPARFWGLVVVVDDIDACAADLGERVGAVRDAVQPGRRIATVRREAGLALPVALMSPEPRKAGS